MASSIPYEGLTDIQAAESRRKHGPNVLTPPHKTPLWRQFIDKFNDPLIIILLIAGVLSIGISLFEYYSLETSAGVFFEPIGIFAAIFLATGLSFAFELRAGKAFDILNQVNDDEPVQVIRNGAVTSIPKRDVVVDDICILNTGDEIPADGVLLEATMLSVDESSLTGEPVCSKTVIEADFDPDATFPSDHVLRGTKVMEGHAVFRVTAVGDSTENGRVFEAAQIDDSTRTPLNEQLDRLGSLISYASYIIGGTVIVGKLLVFFNWNPLALTLTVPIAAIFYLLIFPSRVRKRALRTSLIIACGLIFAGLTAMTFELSADSRPWAELIAYTLQTIMIAVTLIVVSVPEGLPMAVTLSLASSMRRMLRTSNLVRKLHACETMGAVNVICTDKTGTLTQNRMQVSATDFYDTEQPGTRDIIMQGIALNSTAQLDRTGSQEHPAVIGNPTEGALLLWLHDQGVDYKLLRGQAHITEELPFSTERKYMATVANMPDGTRMLYVKGAPEIVYGLCSRFPQGITRESTDRQLARYQSQGMRTLGFAYSPLSPEQVAIADGHINCDTLSFAGIVAIADPVRTDVPEAIQECLDAGIAIKIVTGDTPGTAREIGRQIGLWTDADSDCNIITGTEFAALSDDELADRIDGIKIIARARPMDKKRLVETLKSNNRIVAVTGDGTNDAPALKAAHVGLSMGDGTSVAKEASDITIIDNSFSSIGRAVMWGRSLYLNIQRFILFQLTVNVVACLIVLVGSFMGMQSPLTVTQMLWVNLIMDTFAAMALASLPPSRQVMHDRPRSRSAFIITRAMFVDIAVTGILFFIILLVILYIFEHASITSMASLLHPHFTGYKGLSDYELSLFFTTFVMLQFWNLFNARAYATGRSAFHLKGCNGFCLTIAVIFIGQIAIVTFGGEFFNVAPLHLNDWVAIVGSTSIVLWGGELAHLLRSRRKSKPYITI